MKKNIEHKNYKENISNDQSAEFMKAISVLRKRLEVIHSNNRIDILMHMLISKGILDLINSKKGIFINPDDYADLSKEDYINTANNVISELKFYENELDGLIN